MRHPVAVEIPKATFDKICRHSVREKVTISTMITAIVDDYAPQKDPVVLSEMQEWARDLTIHRWYDPTSRWLDVREKDYAGAPFSISDLVIGLGQMVVVRPDENSRLHQTVLGRIIGHIGGWERFHPRSIGRRTMYRRTVDAPPEEARG